MDQTDLSYIFIYKKSATANRSRVGIQSVCSLHIGVTKLSDSLRPQDLGVCTPCKSYPYSICCFMSYHVDVCFFAPQ